MIISGGENVYPGEVEEVLRGHPDVEDAVVIGVEDEQFGQRLVAFVVPRPGSGLTAEDVIGVRAARTSRASRCRARCSCATSCRATRSGRCSGEN